MDTFAKTSTFPGNIGVGVALAITTNRLFYT